MNWLEKTLNTYQKHGMRGVAEAVARKAGMRDHSNTFSGPVSRVWTDYLAWLTFAIPGMLVQGNIDCMDYAVSHLPNDSPILEIGSFCGLSTNVITYLKQRHNVANRLVTCDKWIFEGADGGGLLGDSRTVNHREYKRFIKESFLRNVGLFSRDDLPFTIELFSDDFFSCWSRNEMRTDVFNRNVQLGGPVSFCYIDGNHSYDFARRDFDNCDRNLESGGFILFDDSADDSDWEVRRVVQEVAATGRYKLLARNPNYFFEKL